jgi:hypothetical protein
VTWPPPRSRDGGVDRVPLPSDRGQLWLCGKHVVGPDVVEAMEAIGATDVVCLNERSELATRYPEYVAWLDAGRGAHWHPIPDLHAPSVEDARVLVAQVRGLLDAGATVLMHCGAGIGRAGTMAAAVLMTYGIPVAEAVAIVARHRPMAGPEAGAQRELLEALHGTW